MIRLTSITHVLISGACTAALLGAYDALRKRPPLDPWAYLPSAPGIELVGAPMAVSFGSYRLGRIVVATWGRSWGAAFMLVVGLVVVAPLARATQLRYRRWVRAR